MAADWDGSEERRLCFGGGFTAGGEIGRAALSGRKFRVCYRRGAPFVKENIFSVKQRGICLDSCQILMYSIVNTRGKGGGNAPPSKKHCGGYGIRTEGGLS